MATKMITHCDRCGQQTEHEKRLKVADYDNTRFLCADLCASCFEMVLSILEDVNLRKM